MNVARGELIQRLFPRGAPRLWCPVLTHFRDDGSIDEDRQRRHLRSLHPAVGGILVAGSTGEGWEMAPAEIADLLDIVIDEAELLGLDVLIGALEPTAPATYDAVVELDRFVSRAPVVGFTICPPTGAHGQSTLATELGGILALGVPTALYQLPQVTRNALEVSTVAALASEYPNLVMFKDTSGDDEVARTISPDHGLVLLRGAEAGGYDGWLRAAGGPYDGFLLGSANVASALLAQVIDGAPSGPGQPADRLARLMSPMFEAVGGIAAGNAFTNVNKAIDHIMAHGGRAAQQPPPRLHSGARLPEAVLDVAEELVGRLGLTPDEGYLDPAG